VAGGDPEPMVSFLDPRVPEAQPRLLVKRLLYARTLIQANPVLAPRFQLGDCAAAHHIVLGTTAIGLVAAERLRLCGLRVQPSIAPPGLRFVLSSSHSEAQIEALMVALMVVVGELSGRYSFLPPPPRRTATGTMTRIGSTPRTIR